MEEDKKEIIKIKHLLHENLLYSKKILISTEKVRKYMLTLQIINAIKLVLILLPIVLAIIYLPSLMVQLRDNYKEIFLQIESLKSGEIDSLDTNVLKNIWK